MTVQRWKLSLRDGRTVYVYGNGPWGGVTTSDCLHTENAGHYDPATNTVHMTEPTMMQDGRTVFG